MSRLARYPLLALSMLLFLHVAPAVQAQSYPSKNITIIVPFPPGGPTDTVARFLSTRLSQAFGVSVVVDNRPGAGATVGTQAAARAEKDGHTLLLTTSIVMNLVFLKEPGYRYEDFTPISTTYISPMVLCVRASLPVKDVREFVAYAKDHPGKLNAAMVGTTGAYQLMMGSLRERAGIDIVGIAYKGAADGLRDLVAGQIDMFFTDTSGAVPQMRDGKIKILATASKERVAGLNVPTMDEFNIPIESGSVWTGLYAPAGTPAAIISRLNAEIVRIIATPEYQNMLRDNGTIPFSSTPAEFDAQQRESLQSWSAMKTRMKIESQ